MDWSAAWLAIVSIVIGAAVAFLFGQVESRRRIKVEKAIRIEERDHALELWQRDKRAALVERAVTAGSVILIDRHPDHEDWKREMAQTYFQMRIYCSPDTAAAFKIVMDGLVLVAQNADSANHAVIQHLQGSSNLYLQSMARHELGLACDDEDPETAKARFEAVLAARGSDIKAADADDSGD